MQDILELIRVLEQHNIYLPHSPPQVAEQDAIVLRLFEGVRVGQFSSDADAASDITPGASADNSNYFETRSLLRERLAQAIERFVAELEQCPDTQQVHIECQKLWLNVRTLSGQNAVKLALDLAVHILEIAQKFEFTLLAMDVAMYLRLQHCMRDTESQSCADADATYQQLRQAFEAEFQAEKMYLDLMALCGAGHTSDEDLQYRAKESTGDLAPLLAAYSSSKLHLYGNLVALQQHLLAHDYMAARNHCEKSIRFFLDKPYRARDPLQVFYYHLLLCSIHLRDVELGKQAAYSCLELAGENGTNQFKVKELLFILHLHTRRYDDAIDLFSEVMADSRFAFLPDTIRANWAVFDWYLSFLNSCGVGALPAVKYKFNGPSAAHWQYQNCARLIIEFVNLIREKQLEKVRRQVPELEQLSTRENGAARGRSGLFVQMLLQIPASDFQRIRAEQLAGEYLAQLRAMPLELANTVTELEVLPFEDLWHLVLQTLDAQ